MSERQPTLSRRSRVWCLLGAVLALLAGCALPAAATQPPGPAATAARAHAVVAYEDGGPSCAPGTGDHGRPPAVPPRAGDHAHVPAAGRLSADRAWDGRAIPVRDLVRGPDQPAPGPVELSVMRV
ncbi:hypothetical protein J7E99_23205 [Streptomyces sp. ISL-44]|uniref:hypothetical protein n=1 Tax=Streptomyces sp. ISL-44 TaxID=2819184 RepID=UPI001BE75638|nr:hypothetical protein [Streptomyces sp. ISL-44]MBT2543522.1 hypothetical protein [Streptomyces sp. ISL-44]